MQLLTEADLLEDTIIFGLRMGQGVSLNELQQRFSQTPGKELKPFLNSLEADGLAKIINDDQVKLTLKGKLLADRIAVEFIEWNQGKISTF